VPNTLFEGDVFSFIISEYILMCFINQCSHGKINLSDVDCSCVSAGALFVVI
jgi:hypothetical protein